MILPQKLREYRKKNGLTQAELAEASGVTRQIIHLLETSGEPCVRLKTAKAIANTLGVTINDLLEASEDG